MKKSIFTTATLMALGSFSLASSAAVTIYDKDDTKVTVDGSFNAFEAKGGLDQVYYQIFQEQPFLRK